MQITLRTTWLLLILSCLIIFSDCRQGPVKLPASYSEFPTDTSIQIIQSFPYAVSENSGLIVIADKIWTHNDSGDDPVLYEMSIEKGTVLKEVSIGNAGARDWEDIDQDSHFVYVGDFGNNGGKRQDLAIYKINKTDLLDEDKSAVAQKLNFVYPDRLDFKPPAYKHNFDCETLLATEDSLYIFSKNHLDNHTRLYSLANNLTEQTATFKARLNTKGVITGGGLDKENNILGLVGYYFLADGGGFAPFVWLFWDYPDHDFLSGKSQRVNLPILAQAEGICYWKDGQFLISTERSRGMRAKILVLDAKKWVKKIQ